MASIRVRASFVALLWLLTSLAPGLSGCGSGVLLANVGASASAISPNGKSVDNATLLTYSVSAQSRVSIWLESETGKRYTIREKEFRSPGTYQARFDGTYAPNSSPDRRVLPDGSYTFVVEVEDERGKREEARGKIAIKDADTFAPEIQNVAAMPDAISPDGDSKDDETLIQYELTKDAEVTITAMGADGERFLLEAPNWKKAALYAHDWNGTTSNKLLKDGKYTVFVQARDKAGNVTQRSASVTIDGGGTPKLQITKVEFSPTAVYLGGDLNVKVKVKNTGDTIVRTMGPPPGTAYSTNMTYNYWLEDDNATPKYYERPGFWRVAVMWNLAGSPYPVRWGLPKDLAPGEEAIVTGTIQILSRTPELRFWASVEQSGVGFPGGDVGIQRIRVSY